LGCQKYFCCAASTLTYHSELSLDQSATLAHLLAAAAGGGGAPDGASALQWQHQQAAMLAATPQHCMHEEMQSRSGVFGQDTDRLSSSSAAAYDSSGLDYYSMEEKQLLGCPASLLRLLQQHHHPLSAVGGGAVGYGA
jgi:hypothetical protein